MPLQTLDHHPEARLPPPPAPPPRRQRPRRRRAPLSKVSIAMCSGALLLIVLAVPALLLMIWMANTADAMISGLPALPDAFEQAPERSLVLDRNGKRLATLQIENRKTVELDKVPDHVVNAVLATEDRTFWEHAGVNWAAVMRSALRIASSGEIEGGGSTITQQVVKNRFVGAAQSFKRKISEAALAAQVERRIGKREILQTYLNDTYFGNGVYGIATAAEYYWRKPVGELTVAEGALLAGIIRAPEANNPVDGPEHAVERRNIVLDQMAEAGMLSPEQAARASEKPLNLNVKDAPSRGSPFLIDAVRRELEADPALGEMPEERWDTVLRGGLRIRTTLDADLQRIAEKTIDEVLPNKKKDPLASIVAVEPATGEVRAVAVGPKDYGEGNGKTTVNPAMPGLGGKGRPSGSAFKAFELVTALEHDVSPTRVFKSGPTYTSKHPDCSGYKVTNYGGEDLGTLNMATATAKSSNTYFVHLMDIAGGSPALIEVAHRLGIASDIEPHCAAVLGSENVFPVEMASAFGTLANEGKRCRPHTVRAIRDPAGEVLRKGDGDCKRVMDEKIAHTTTALLRGPIERGTASDRGQIGRPAAGKTGTTTDNKDAWFVGYIPQLSAATWVGHEIPETLVHPLCGEVTGGCLPTILWQRFMVAAIEKLELPVERFPKPPPPPKREVPRVIGMDEQAARRTLIKAQFVPKVKVVDDAAPAGTVVDQDPRPRQKVPEGGTVTISVSNGKRVIKKPKPKEQPLPHGGLPDREPINEPTTEPIPLHDSDSETDSEPDPRPGPDPPGHDDNP